MEKDVKIKTPDGKIIEGILRGNIKKPLILIVHGLCGNINEAMHYNAARYFEKQGFSSFRFNLYSWGKDNRKLHECTLKTHGADIDLVLKFLKSTGAQKIFAIGHSYGFPALLHSKANTIETLVSWDGSVLPRDTFLKKPSIIKPVKGRLIDEGYLTIMGEGMAKEQRNVNSIELAQDFNKPIKLITIPKDGNLIGAKNIFRVLSEPKELTIIKGASHNFTEEGKQEELYYETIQWFKKFE
ncbi:MAG: alpha/beta fold hydrolase [Nitrosopumilus sp.]|nr:alpha/beta fold hydrolase [Nitrosopumilus sp.]